MEALDCAPAEIAALLAYWKSGAVPGAKARKLFQFFIEKTTYDPRTCTFTLPSGERLPLTLCRRALANAGAHARRETQHAHRRELLNQPPVVDDPEDDKFLETLTRLSAGTHT